MHAFRFPTKAAEYRDFLPGYRSLLPVTRLFTVFGLHRSVFIIDAEYYAGSVSNILMEFVKNI